MNEELEKKQKELFAARLLKVGADPFKIAFEMFPNNTSRALWVANYWPADADVIESMQAIRDADKTGESLLPSEADFKMLLWRRMQGADNDELAKLSKIYAETSGFVKKESGVTVNNNFVPKVIVIKDHGSVDQWESTAQKQQRDLLNVSDTKH